VPLEDFLFTTLHDIFPVQLQIIKKLPVQKINMFQVKKSKNSIEVYPTEFLGSTQNHNKIIKIPNQPIETKTFRFVSEFFRYIRFSVLFRFVSFFKP
jgi:hypothetical protein